jgi:hypothetical protein
MSAKCTELFDMLCFNGGLGKTTYWVCKLEKKLLFRDKH